MDEEAAITAVGHAIQLSVAPVFLLSGIGAMLAVMANRLSRIVDRGRQVESWIGTATPADMPRLGKELAVLSLRAKLTYRSIAFCTITALFVCALVVTLFIGAFLRYKAAIPVAILFVAAMSTFFTGLLLFLREVFVATVSLRLGPFAGAVDLRMKETGSSGGST